MEWSRVFVKRIERRNRRESEGFRELYKAYKEALEENQKLLYSAATSSSFALVTRRGISEKRFEEELKGEGNISSTNSNCYNNPSYEDDNITTATSGQEWLEQRQKGDYYYYGSSIATTEAMLKSVIDEKCRMLSVRSMEMETLRNLLKDREEELADKDRELQTIQTSFEQLLREQLQLKQQLEKSQSQLIEKSLENDQVLSSLLRFKQSEATRLHDLQALYMSIIQNPSTGYPQHQHQQVDPTTTMTTTMNTTANTTQSPSRSFFSTESTKQIVIPPPGRSDPGSSDFSPASDRITGGEQGSFTSRPLNTEKPLPNTLLQLRHRHHPTIMSSSSSGDMDFIEQGTLLPSSLSLPKTIRCKISAHQGSVNSCHAIASISESTIADNVLVSAGFDGNLALSRPSTTNISGPHSIFSLGNVPVLMVESRHQQNLLPTSLSKLVLATMADFTIYVVNVYTQRRLASLKAHTNRITGCGHLFFQGDIKAFSAGLDRTLRIWDIQQSCCIRTGHAVSGITGAAIHQQTIATAHQNGSVIIWNVTGNDFHKVGTIQGHQHLVTGVAFSHDGAYVASQSKDHTIQIIDPVALRVLATFSDVHNFRGEMAVDSVPRFSPDNAFLATFCGPSLCIWPVNGGGTSTPAVVKSIDDNCDISSLGWTDTFGLVTGTTNGSICFWR